MRNGFSVLLHRARFTRIVAVMRAEVGYLLRDRLTLSLIGIVPAVQLILFGYTVNLDPKNISVAVAQVAPMIEIPILQTLATSGYFKTVAQDLPPGNAVAMLKARQALIAIEPARSGNAIEIFVDASDPAAVRPALLALQSQLWREVNATAQAESALRVTWLYNTDGITSWAITPGLSGVIVMITTLMLSALCLVRERESGTWQTLMVAPLIGYEVLLGKLLPLWLLALAQAALVISLSHWLFAVPVRGSIAALAGAVSLFAAAHLLFGFILSTLVASQLQAIQAAIFFYLPCMLLSGFMFPFEGMPRWAQWLGEGLPLTHFVRAARGVLLRGEGVHLVAIEMLPVAIFVVVATAVALYLYHYRWLVTNRS